jgi:cytochrome b
MKEIKAWDLYIRLNHWLMVLLFTGLVVTGKSEEDYMQWHFYMGYLLSATLITRLLYGFWGAKLARFSMFLTAPKNIYYYAKQLVKGQAPHYLGHNPLGGIMVLVLLISLVLQIVSGLVNSDEVFWYGPMYEWVSEDLQEWLADWHAELADILLALVACHLLAVLVHELALKERLIKAMFNGKKPISSEPYADQSGFDQETKAVRKTVRKRLVIMLSLSLIYLYWLWQLPI